MTELRVFAEQVLCVPDWETKTATPPDGVAGFSDADPGPPVSLELPARSEAMRFFTPDSVETDADPGRAPTMPKPKAFREPRHRGVAHHIMANHELQALEVMASTLLRYPAAPAEFRLGVARIMLDEQRHTRMHAARAAKHGVPFGSLPVNGYIWLKSLAFRSELDYLAGLPLVFEGANLDHSLEFSDYFEAAGDPKGAAVMRQIHVDEIDHVAFGLDWLRRFKPPGADDWETFVAHLHEPLTPAKAAGRTRFEVEARRTAGMDDPFIAQLREATGH